jgi:hypothetical protein
MKSAEKQDLTMMYRPVYLHPVIWILNIGVYRLPHPIVLDLWSGIGIAMQAEQLMKNISAQLCAEFLGF